jgi:hypothetical protein
MGGDFYSMELGDNLIAGDKRDDKQRVELSKYSL